jgi:hypothetical protein
MFFISGGCSYSQVPNTDITWPVHVQKAFGLAQHEVDHTAIGASGNKIISRRVIHRVLKALKTHKPEDLLVGILWSGCDRHSLMLRENPRTYNKCTKLMFMPHTYAEFLKAKPSIVDMVHTNFNNPVTIGDDTQFNHYILNSHWEDELTVTYYNDFVDALGSIVQTCEDILRTEWFLKKHNIKYFMAEYDFDTFFYAGVPDHYTVTADYDKDCLALECNDQKHKCDVYDPDIKYLYDMIDKDYWLPIDNLASWAKNVSKFDFRDPPDPHPSTEQHIDFTNQIILPFLKNKYGMSCPQLP